MTLHAFQVTQPLLTHGQRQTSPVDLAYVIEGEWLLKDATTGKLRRPQVGDSLDESQLMPVLTGSNRSDYMSAGRATKLHGIGAEILTSVYHSGSTPQVSAIASTADGDTTLAPDTFTAAGQTFAVSGVTTADYLYIMTGADAGVYPLTTATIGATTLVFASPVGFAGDVGADWAILKSTAVAFTAGAGVRVALYQDLDTPSLLRSGLIPDDADIIAVPADGVTAGLVLFVGPVVGVLMSAAQRLTGVGRGNGSTVLPVRIK